MRPADSEAGFAVYAALKTELKAMAAEDLQNIVKEGYPEQPPEAQVPMGDAPEEISERLLFAGNEDFYESLAKSKAESKPMAPEGVQNIVEEGYPEQPAEAQVPTGDAPEEIAERQLFAGNEDFYEFLAKSAETDADGQLEASHSALAPLRRFSVLQILLFAIIIVLTIMLIYGLLASGSRAVSSFAPAKEQESDQQQASVMQQGSVSRESHLAEPASSQPIPVRPQEIQQDQAIPPSAEPLSLEMARDFCVQGDYSQAYDVYRLLDERFTRIGDEELMKDFLQLRMALCMKKMAETEQARRLFGRASKSSSLAVSAIASYHLSLLEYQRKEYLRARTRAYQTIALIEAVDFDRDWVLSIQRDCHFLVAECLTSEVLGLCDADKDIPAGLWATAASTADPLTELSETQLRAVLQSGLAQLNKRVLGPEIRNLTGLAAPRQARWSAACDGASIEELLARFSANAQMDVHWACGKEEKNIRKRAVRLCLPSATLQGFVSAAAGCVGLLGFVDDNNDAPSINVYNPAEYSMLSEHVTLLSRQAISLWQKFLLTFYGDERVGNAHFALGLLRAQRGEPTEAIAECKLVTNRFSRTPLAPLALLHSSGLKADLLDYSGAREDLKRLVEQYDDADFVDKAYLHLADVTKKAGLIDEAGRVYRKIYHLGVSVESQAISALEAAGCFYQKKDYENTLKWLERHLSLAKEQSGKDLHSAYFLLGETNLALGKLRQACDAFEYALEANVSKQKYVETISALVKGYIEQEDFIEALAVLESIPPMALTEKESIEMSLLKSKILRSMGLIDRATAALFGKDKFVSDPWLKARVSFEMAKCHIAEGNLELARERLAKTLLSVKSGPLAHEISVELAEVCFKLKDNSQAIRLCTQVLELEPDEPVRRKALDLLARAYSRQKNYDRATSALLGWWNETETLNRAAAPVNTPTAKLNRAPKNELTNNQQNN